MSTSLQLLPIDLLHADWWGLSHTVLTVPQNSELFEAIRGLPSEVLPITHSVSSPVGGRTPGGERCYGVLGTDVYGERYRWITAHALAAVLDRLASDHPTTAYIRVLAKRTVLSETVVILDWS